MSTQELLEGLTEAQVQAVTHADGPLLVLAGPGSGKTRVITHRAAHLARTVTQARHILAITFTNKAASEMTERLARLPGAEGVTASTFHSFCARQLRIHCEAVGLAPNFSIFDDADQMSAIRGAVERCGLSSENFPARATLSVISRAKNDMIDPAAFAAEASGFQEKSVAKIFEAYAATLAEQNAVDFDDLLVKTAALLKDHADVRDQLENRYQYVLVDEYQDTNVAQYSIARLLTVQRENLCVTGDPDQSIYAWRGANLDNILRFEEDFPNTAIVRLEQNYRSTPQILRAADAVIRKNHKRKVKALWTGNQDGPTVLVAECEDAMAEGRFIAKRIHELVEQGRAHGEIAVFYRTNALTRSIEIAMQDARIPYQVARGVAFFQRKEIKDILAYLKVISNPLDLVSLSRIINTPSRGIGKTSFDRLLAYAVETKRPVMELVESPGEIPGISRAQRHLEAFAALINECRQIAEQGNVQDTLEAVIRRSGLVALWSGAGEDDAMENAAELVNGAAEYDRQHADGGGSLADWLQQISLFSDIDAIDEHGGAVTLMTLHAAKGLEFDTVFMAGVEEGLLPHERSRNEQGGIEEERRLCFVGMTRAKRELTMTSARFRAVRGAEHRTSRSVFLSELPVDEVKWLSVDEDGITHDSADIPEEASTSPASSAEWLEWRGGQLGRHPSVLLGRVVWMHRPDQRTHAGVQFTSYGEKTLVLEYAGLEPVEFDDLEYEG